MGWHCPISGEGRGLGEGNRLRWLRRERPERAVSGGGGTGLGDTGHGAGDTGQEYEDTGQGAGGTGGDARDTGEGLAPRAGVVVACRGDR